MKEITLEKVNEMGFIEKIYRPWEKDKPFLIHLFSNRWLDLFQKRSESIVYLATITDINSINV